MRLTATRKTSPNWRAWRAGGSWIECRDSERVGVERLRARGIPDPARPDLTEERVVRLNCEYPYTGDGLLLDTDQCPVEECLARIESYLGKEPRHDVHQERQRSGKSLRKWNVFS